MKNQIYCVLELGSNRVSALAFEGESANLNPLAFFQVPLNGMWKGEVVSPDKCSDGVRTVLREIENSLGHSPDALFVSASSTAFSSTIGKGFLPIVPRGRKVTKDDVLQVINHSRQSSMAGNLVELQAVPMGFKLDRELISSPPMGQPASRLEAETFLILAPKEQVQTRNSILANAGCSCDQMISGPLASGLGVLNGNERELGTVCIDIGESKTDISVFVNGGLGLAATIPIGGRNVTQDISGLLKTTHEEAERLKLKFGVAMKQLVTVGSSVEVFQISQSGPRPLEQSVLCEIIESRMKELAKLCQKEVDAYYSLSSLPGGLVLTGGGSMLRGTAALFEQYFKVSRVRLGSSHLDLSDFSASHELAPASLAAISGMAYYAHKDADDELTTMNPVQGIKDRVRTFWSIISQR